MALDRCAEDPRSFIEAASPSHPSLIDTEHVLADLYAIINVPTAIWIDEGGTIVRPNDVAFGSEVFRDLTGFDSAAYLDAVRAWVSDGALPAKRNRCWTWPHLSGRWNNARRRVKDASLNTPLQTDQLRVIRDIPN